MANGRGLIAHGRLVEAQSRHTRVRLEHYQQIPKEAPRRVLAVAPPKSAERTDWIVEKATELDVDRLVFLHTDRLEKRRIKMERLEAKAVSALKQCGRAWLPVIVAMTGLDTWLEQAASPGMSLLSAHCGHQNRKPLWEAIPQGGPATLIVGPEGDFSDREIRLMEAHGAQSIDLGPLILRTETAALAALAQLILLQERPHPECTY